MACSFKAFFLSDIPVSPAGCWCPPGCAHPCQGSKGSSEQPAPVSSDQWDHSAGLSQAPGAQDDPGSYFPVGSEVLGCPTAFTWARVGGSSAQVLLCPQVCGAQRLHKPADIQKVSPFFAQLWGQPGSFGPPCWAVDTTSPCCAAAHTWPPPAPRACVSSFCTVRERIPSFCCSCK